MGMTLGNEANCPAFAKTYLDAFFLETSVQRWSEKTHTPARTQIWLAQQWKADNTVCMAGEKSMHLTSQAGTICICRNANSRKADLSFWKHGAGLEQQDLGPASVTFIGAIFKREFGKRLGAFYSCTNAADSAALSLKKLLDLCLARSLLESTEPL